MATAIYNAVTQLTQADVYQNWNSGNNPDILAVRFAFTHFVIIHFKTLSDHIFISKQKVQKPVFPFYI